VAEQGAAGARRNDIGQAPGQNIGAPAGDLGERRRLLLEGAQAMADVMLVNGGDRREVVIRRVADGERRVARAHAAAASSAWSISASTAARSRMSSPSCVR